MIHTQLYLMSVSILGEQEKIMTVLKTAWPDVYCQHRQSDRQTDMRIYCLSLVSQQPR